VLQTLFEWDFTSEDAKNKNFMQDIGELSDNSSVDGSSSDSQSDSDDDQETKLAKKLNQITKKMKEREEES
jgi:hypothetical protein